MNQRFHNIQIVSSSTKNNEYRFSNPISKFKSLFNNYTKNWKKKRKKEKETKNELCLQASISSSMSSEATPRSREKLLGFMTFPLLPIATKIQDRPCQITINIKKFNQLSRFKTMLKTSISSV